MRSMSRKVRGYARRRFVAPSSSTSGIPGALMRTLGGGSRRVGTHLGGDSPAGGAPGVLIRNLGRSSWRFDTQPWGGPSDLNNVKIKLLKDANNLGRPSSSVLARAARRPSSSSSCQSGVGVLLSKLIRKPSLLLSLEVPLGSRVGRKSTSDLPEAPHSRCSLLRILPRRVQREGTSRRPPSFFGSRGE